jgi:hypothetical protein
MPAGHAIGHGLVVAVAPLNVGVVVTVGTTATGVSTGAAA